jgi:hypothetical protein
MSWSLAGNLDSRSDSVKAEYPGITIWSIGDQSHQSKNSDHNPDARDIVHAIDVMTYSDTARGEAVKDWCLEDTTDLEYVIFNRKIYSRSNGFAASNYSGSDPHEDHVHISGKHGNTGYSDATGTGYDTAAEAYRPEGMDGMAYSEADMQAFPWQYDGRGMRGVPEGQSTLWTFGEIYANLLAVMENQSKMLATVDAISQKVEDLTNRRESGPRPGDDG